MAHANEAVCLHETGVLYGRRTLLQPTQGDPIFAGFKPGAFSLYYGDAPIFHFDREGRWQRCYLDDLHYLRSLDGTIQSVDRVREGVNLVLKRRTLAATEAIDLDGRVRAAALELLDDLVDGRLANIPPPPKAQSVSTDELIGFLKKVAAWDAEAWAADVSAYRETYGPLPFLTPECTSAVILQATVGHPRGRAFGDAEAFPHSVRSRAEFASHVRAVSDLLGERITQCKAVFLGGADVLRRPVYEIAAYLEAVAGVLPIEATQGPRHPDPTGQTPHRLQGVHAFLDDFAPGLLNVQGWQRLRSLGLTRVSLGVESGDPEHRKARGLVWSADDLHRLVTDLKAAGIGVGVLVLVRGQSGDQADREVELTAELLNRLPLGAGDIVSLVDASELAAAAVVDPLSRTTVDAVRDALKARLASLREAKAKVVPYSFDKQGLG